MRILAIYRHYWPDITPYARILRSLLAELSGEGHSFTVFTAQPSYNDVEMQPQPREEELDGVKVHRSWCLTERKSQTLVRCINHLIFISQCAWFVFRRRNRFDMILVPAHPPVIMSTFMGLFSRLMGLPYVLHCQDIHPEAAINVNDLNNGMVRRICLFMDSLGCRGAAAVVTLSEDMKSTLVNRVPGIRVEVINNFPPDLLSAAGEMPESFLENGDRESPIRILFAGNMGRYQAAERVIDAALLLRDRLDIHFVFMGSGQARSRLMARAGDALGKTIFFEPQQSVETAIKCMERADLGVVSLAPGISSVAYPSKTIAYLCAGCPVLGLVDPNSTIEVDIRQCGHGVIPSSPQAADIARAVRQFRRRTADERVEIKARAVARFGKQVALKRWQEIFRESFTN